jgi:hypothetical protein
MPIRFTCDHCDSTLSVSSRKAGLAVTCPKCRQKTPVPAANGRPQTESVDLGQKQDSDAVEATALGSETATSAPRQQTAASPPKTAAPQTASAGATGAPPTPPPTPAEAVPADAISTMAELELLSSLPAPEDEVTWEVEDAQPRIHSDYHSGVEIDFDKVALPRYVLYGQGVLLAGVAMVALVLGVVIGRLSGSNVATPTSEVKTCYLTGTVSYTSSGGSVSPDAGAVVIVVPQDRQPSRDAKIPIEGLRPGDPLPQPDQPAIARLKAIGGDYDRADERGNFKLRVDRTGEYFVLVVGRNAPRQSTERPEGVHLAQMGRYFLPASELIGDQRYAWRMESIKRDKEYKFTLE